MPVGVNGPHHRAVHQDLDLLVAGTVVAPLGGAEADLIGAGDGKSTAWLIVPVCWRKATWLPCGSIGVAVGEGAAVARHAGRAAEAPRRARRIILEADLPAPESWPSNPGSRMLAGAP